MAVAWSLDGCVTRKEERTWEDFMVIGKAPTVTTQTKAKMSLVRHIWRHTRSTLVLLLFRAFIFENLVFLNPILLG